MKYEGMDVRLSPIYKYQSGYAAMEAEKRGLETGGIRARRLRDPLLRCREALEGWFNRVNSLVKRRSIHV